MKKGLLLLAGCMVFLMSSLAWGEAVPLVTGEWPPFVSEHLEGYGLCGKIVTAVFEEMEEEAAISFLPWKRCEVMLQKGEAWGAFPYAITEERQKEFLFTDPFTETRTVFFALREIPFEKLEDLQGLSIGGSRGTFYEQLFLDAGLTVDWANDEETSFKKLFAERVDVVAVAEVVGWEIIKTNHADRQGEIVVLSQSLQSTQNAIMVSKSYPGAAELAKKFNQALQVIRDKGTYGEILASYGLSE